MELPLLIMLIQLFLTQNSELRLYHFLNSITYYLVSLIVLQKVVSPTISLGKAHSLTHGRHSKNYHAILGFAVMEQYEHI